MQESANAVYSTLRDLKNTPEGDGFVNSLDQASVLNLVENTRLEMVKIFEDAPDIETVKPELIRNAAISMAGKLVEIEQLNSELNTSYLTGLPNQRAAARVICDLINNNDSFAWTFFDLDRLKSLNLAYGEHAADRLIRAIGERLKNNMRCNEPDGKNDMVAHRSGDEFWLILNHADLKGGMIASQKLLDVIRQKPLTIKINEDDSKYVRDLEITLRNKLDKDGGLEEFENIALSMTESAMRQIDEQETSGACISKRASDKGKKIYFVSIGVTASMGCTAFLPQENPGCDTQSCFEQMSSRIKSSEEKAKQDGRNCVRGFDGEHYYALNDDRELEAMI